MQDVDFQCLAMLVGLMPKISYTLRIPEELRDALQALADADKRTLANYVQMVLEAHVEGQNARPVKRK